MSDNYRSMWKDLGLDLQAHAKGARVFFPESKAVLDIGGQDSKAISLDPEAEAFHGLRLSLFRDLCLEGREVSDGRDKITVTTITKQIDRHKSWSSFLSARSEM